MDVAELQGQLCLVHNMTRNVEAWVMKDYGMKESWTKLFNMENSFGQLKPLCWTIKNCKILLKWDCGLILYDLKTKIVSSLQIPGKRAIPECDARTYMESIVGL
ncbi:hypothetical protein IFM89_000196 [Coptis chinensis]|uniref:F-box protein n=1 Tax=Coptis chinensis TaxID=261450 RepID=A0A835IAR9_9MAGN|nr:hypothetical protein IFM89_000196 [Coptis chinensis]